MFQHVRLHTSLREPVPPRTGWQLALALLSLTAAVSGARHGLTLALVTAAGALALARRPATRTRDVSTGGGSLKLDDGVLHVGLGDPVRIGRPWQVSWPLTSLRSGHIEEQSGLPSSAFVVLTHESGATLRLSLAHRQECRALINALGLNMTSRSVRFALPTQLPPLAQLPLDGLRLAARLGSIGALVLTTMALAQLAFFHPVGDALARDAWRAAGLALLVTWLARLLTPSPGTLAIGHDGMVLPHGQFLPWRDVARVTRTARGLRLTSGRWAPIEIHLQSTVAPPLPQQRAGARTRTAALRDAILRALEQHRRRRPDLLPELLDDTTASYRAPSAPLAALWTTLCTGHEPVAARIAAADELAHVEPALIAAARQRLVEPTVTDALARLRAR